MTEKLRVYGAWGGNPKGQPEDKTRCIKSVHPPHRGAIAKQCSNRRGFGPSGEYCRIHDPEAVRARNQTREAKYAAERESLERKWNDQYVGSWLRVHDSSQYETILKKAK